MENEDFEEQIRQQEIEEKSSEDVIGRKRTKVDPDGTEYEWDVDKKAWFPKIDQDFIAKYQMQYGSYKDPEAKEEASSNKEKATPSSDTSKAPDPSDPNYAQWYYSYYYGQSSEGESTEATQSPPLDTTSEAYRVWYEYYYGDQAAGESKENKDVKSGTTDDKDEQNDSGVSVEETGKESGGKGDTESVKDSETQVFDHGKPDSSHDEFYAYWKEFYASESVKKAGTSDSDSYKEYWTWYYAYYGGSDSSQEQGSQEKDAGKGDKEAAKAEENGKGQKGVKRKPTEERGWFEMDGGKSTSVYISGLPTDITEEQFKELMNKCGLVMFDPFTRKPKLKLYKDAKGNLKGDGLCVYIKPESVELALNILDDYEYEGHKLHVEMAKFEMKGTYDPAKGKKKKLGNKAKRKFIEKQEKLFDWRPDQPVGGRQKWEKVVIIKNVFDPKEFEVDPTQINEIRNDLREECTKFGEVKKVTVYDRHPDGICSVSFKEPEEADTCIEALRGRWFAQRRLVVQQWDGKEKYEIEESEEEREARMAKWANFLEDEEEKKRKAKEMEKEKAEGEKKMDSGQQATAPAAMTGEAQAVPPEGAQAQS